MTEAILSMRGISKHFGGVQALSNVDLDVYPGEVVALVGDNGAGKSTLVKAICGVNPPDEGEILFQGTPVRIDTPHAAQSLGIATVFQDLALCDNLDVVSNLYLGRERLRLGVLDEVEMERRSGQLLKELSATIPSLRTVVAALSGGQRQTVAISRSLLGEPKVVLLDEPTAALGVSQTEQVLNLISRLRERGLGVMVISHNMVDVRAVADKVVILRLGKVNGRFNMHEVTNEQIIASITGASMNGGVA
ncbi:ATP-binding cassette domain-containing protein [Rhizocola hellebori]|nr:ATP-binding cassette domain-containing protein [Rhizocola hellebori]